MGDRGNIVIRNEVSSGDVWLYSHWGGSELPNVLRDALKRQQRWEDPAYLARIIFCEMVKGQESNETGFGISTVMCDNEHEILVVHTKTQKVSGVEEKQLVAGVLPIDFKANWSKSFAQFAKAKGQS